MRAGRVPSGLLYRGPQQPSLLSIPTAFGDAVHSQLSSPKIPPQTPADSPTGDPNSFCHWENQQLSQLLQTPWSFHYGSPTGFCIHRLQLPEPPLPPLQPEPLTSTTVDSLGCSTAIPPTASPTFCICARAVPAHDHASVLMSRASPDSCH